MNIEISDLNNYCIKTWMCLKIYIFVGTEKLKCFKVCKMEKKKKKIQILLKQKVRSRLKPKNRISLDAKTTEYKYDGTLSSVPMVNERFM